MPDLLCWKKSTAKRPMITPKAEEDTAADGGDDAHQAKEPTTTNSSSSSNKEWTMKPSEMADWVEQVTSQSLEVLHRFAELESATDAVLEVGAGRGTYSRRALDRIPHGAKLVVTDASQEMVDQMRSSTVALPATSSNTQKVEIQQVNAVELPYADDSIDCYLANLVLHHTSDSRKALQEAFRVLKAKGRLCVTEVDALDMGTMFTIPQQAMKLFNIGGETNNICSSHHAHSHGHETAKTEARKKIDQQHDQHHHNHHHHHGHDRSPDHDEHSKDSNTNNQPEHEHDHKHAIRHGGADDLRRMVREAGFADVVAWHLDCVGETHDAERFAQNSMAHKKSKEANGNMTEEQEEQFVQEMRRLAQVELDAGRPITFGTVILTAHKPVSSR